MLESFTLFRLNGPIALVLLIWKWMGLFFAHRRNVPSVSLFDRYSFGRCSLELAQLVPLPYLTGISTRYSDRLHDFSVTIPRCYDDVCINTFFPRTLDPGIACP